KLRRAERKSQKTGSDRNVRKLHQNLHHVEHSLRSFVERELLALLRQSRCWADCKLEIPEIRTSSNRIEFLLLPRDSSDAAVIAFEEQSGKLLASFTAPDWLLSMDPAQRNAFRNALAGLYKLAGVHLVRNQLQ